jgi:hypothetical protein
MDLLSDPAVNGFVIGASNVLFQQKKQLTDVLIDVENATFEIHDPELRKQLVLSTEDLRFVDFLLKNVQHPKEDAEGSEHWIRKQFYAYLVAMLRTVLAGKESDQFNAHYVLALKKTSCYQNWTDMRGSGDRNFDNLQSGHPFALGSLSVADVKLKLAQTMQNSDSGRKITSVVNKSTVVMGGAITSAKGALSNWWTNITTTPAVAMSPAQNSDEKETSENSGKENASLDIPIEIEANEDDENLKAVIEIGKEADLLDKKQKVVGI